MQVETAAEVGFCEGVRRAISIALAARDRHGGVRMEGPLVHNRQVTEYLAARGIGPEAGTDKPYLIRAHGLPPQERTQLEKAGLILVDATCPHIIRNQALVGAAAAEGRVVLLAGDPGHAEVLAVAGAAGGACRVVSRLEDLADIPEGEMPAGEGNAKPSGGVFMLAQTTFDVALFKMLAEELTRRCPRAVITDTICRATHRRQEEARRLGERHGAVIVVGGGASANTRRLLEAAADAGCPRCLGVETAAELRTEDFAGCTSVGVTSGASTPDWCVREVVEWAERL